MPGNNNIPEKEKEFHIKQLEEWKSIISENLPHLSKPQATVLALWSFGMAVIKTCALTSVSFFMSLLLDEKEYTMKQRLREWYCDREDKKSQKSEWSVKQFIKGENRTDIETQGCFIFLLKWVIKHWQSKKIAIALDATNLSLYFTVLAVSVVYRGSAIPVAWTVLVGNEKGSWNKEWFRMLKLLMPAVPKDYMVIVMTDRGLYSPKLFRLIKRLGWHPFMRINAIGTFMAKGSEYFKPISSFAMKPGTRWQGEGIAFKSKDKQLPCTLLAYWVQGEDEAWFIITDLPAGACDPCWYGMRTWIEESFRMTKRGGWQWHRTRMKDPKRAERMWLAISVATIWVLSVGGQADASIPEDTLPDMVSDQSVTLTAYQPKASKPRRVSIFRRGWILILVSLIRHRPLSFGSFMPELWNEASLECCGIST